MKRFVLLAVIILMLCFLFAGCERTIDIKNDEAATVTIKCSQAELDVICSDYLAAAKDSITSKDELTSLIEKRYAVFNEEAGIKIKSFSRNKVNGDYNYEISLDILAVTVALPNFFIGDANLFAGLDPDEDIGSFIAYNSNGTEMNRAKLEKSLRLSNLTDKKVAIISYLIQLFH